MDVPYTLDEATSSNNITFMERASPQVLATDLGAGDNRAAFGIRGNDKWWWAGAYLTGPTTGYDHSLRVPYAATGRLVFVPINTDAGAFLFSGDVLYLADTGGAPVSTKSGCASVSKFASIRPARSPTSTTRWC
jgi:phosphate-selective porin OprO/OprP